MVTPTGLYTAASETVAICDRSPHSAPDSVHAFSEGLGQKLGCPCDEHGRVLGIKGSEQQNSVMINGCMACPLTCQEGEHKRFQEDWRAEVCEELAGIAA
jgi:hypothetical protein